MSRSPELPPPVSTTPTTMTRNRAASVRVRRMERTPSALEPAASPSPPISPSPPPSTFPPRSADPSAPASPAPTGRRRAVTISEQLQDRFETAGGATTGIGAKTSRNRLRAVSIGAGSRRSSSDVPLEPSVQLAGRPRSSSRVSANLSPARSPTTGVPESVAEEEQHHAQEEVDLLDVIDPQVATATTWSNVANTLALPPLSFINRAPVVDLDSPTITRLATIADPIPGEALDLHAEHLVDRKAERKEMIRKMLRGLWDFVRTPIGVVFAFYGLAVVAFGAGLVLMLMIPESMYAPGRRAYLIEVFSQVLNGLFTLTGIGLVPWRLADVYHASWLWTMANRVWRRRRAQGLAPLERRDDLPLHPATDKADSLEKGITTGDGVDPETLLSPNEEARLLHHQLAFQKSQTWYRPHETATHYAFRLDYALWIVLLVWGNSLFQAALCGVMWGINYHDRPAWTTGIFMPLSFLCGIFAGIMIWQGGKRTKKVTEVEAAVRAAAKERKEAEKEAKAHHHPRLHLPHPSFPHHHSKTGAETPPLVDAKVPTTPVDAEQPKL